MNPKSTTGKNLSTPFFMELKGRTIAFPGVSGAGPQWLAARFSAATDVPILWIAPDAQAAERVYSDLQLLLPGRTFSFPGRDTLPFMPVAPSPSTSSERINALYRLAHDSGAFICTTHAAALLEPVMPRPLLQKMTEYVMAGEDVDRDALLKWFITAGYEHVSIVQGRGEFCVRGGLIDFFPPGQSLAVRLDMFGDTVEEIRLFDPLTQRSRGSLEDLVILPVTELPWLDQLVDRARQMAVERADGYQWPARKLNSLLNRLSERQVTEAHQALYPLFHESPSLLSDFVPENALVVFQSPEETGPVLDSFITKAKDAWESARQSNLVLCQFHELIHTPESLFSSLNQKKRWYFPALQMVDSELKRHLSIFDPGGIQPPETMEFTCNPPDIPAPAGRMSRGEGLLGPAFERIAAWHQEGEAVCITCPGSRHAARMAGMISEYMPELPIVQHAADESDDASEASACTLLQDPEPGAVHIVSSSLSQGFHLRDLKLLFVTEDEILGTSARQARRTRRKKSKAPVTFEDLSPGQPVVHLDHGIAIYQGMVRMDIGGADGEFLVLEYQKGDKLYLPVDRLALIQRYTGIEGREPRIDKLGGSTWKLRQQKVRRSIYEIAHDLVDLYAARRVRQGIAFSPPGQMFRQFEAEFPFELTRDQATAVDEILQDMLAPHPMDRLLCGDVGFGKTEVAMRAAFKAVEDGYQVAMMVPTTLLAEQHERTFRRRFRRFPVEIAALSRLKGRKEQKETLEKVRQGEVDILIGTHRLLQSDVQFKNIGLLIVDEEHRFGVKHKEKLKNLRQNMDSLALTATPIPRTLQLSMLGIRDMSTINTPPAERLPVKTYLAEYENVLVKSAIEEEKARGGQVFFVHNRVKGIHTVADTIRRLCPEVKVGVAHGQMSPAELEKIMIEFVRGEIDCLVCTTIIESGIDIPAANTMIINRADTLGLADMYQLRGRVGRGAEQAYAYLLVSSIENMSPDASKRLRAIMEFSSAGGGFKLAMQDLQIRGAGNILGVSQSGQIADVGYDMYLDLLQRAVEELKGTPVQDEIDPEVNLRIPAFIPEEYVPDPGQRLELYRRLGRASGWEERQEIVEELEDRFGKLPFQVINLKSVMEIKELLRELNAIRLDLAQTKGINRMILAFQQDGPPGADKIVQEAARRKKWSLLPDSRLTVELSHCDTPEEMLENIKRGLRTVLEAAKN